jgi:hypothetical protein
MQHLLQQQQHGPEELRPVVQSHAMILAPLERDCLLQE